MQYIIQLLSFWSAGVFTYVTFAFLNYKFSKSKINLENLIRFIIEHSDLIGLTTFLIIQYIYNILINSFIYFLIHLNN